MSMYTNLLGNQIERLNRIVSIAERLFPPLYLIAVLLLDHFIPSKSVAPAFCALGLMGMSFFFATEWMLLWGIVYSLAIITAFFNPTLFQFLNNEPFLPHSIQPSTYARCFGFTATAGFCTLFSLTLSRFRKSHDEILRLLSKFPRPIVISSLTGRVLFFNDEAKKCLSLSYRTQPDTSFFDLFAPREKRAVLIAEYLQQIDDTHSEKTLSLEVGGKPVQGETMLIDSMGEKILVTALMEK